MVDIYEACRGHAKLHDQPDWVGDNLEFATKITMRCESCNHEVTKEDSHLFVQLPLPDGKQSPAQLIHNFMDHNEQVPDYRCER